MGSLQDGLKNILAGTVKALEVLGEAVKAARGFVQWYNNADNRKKLNEVAGRLRTGGAPTWAKLLGEAGNAAQVVVDLADESTADSVGD